MRGVLSSRSWANGRQNSANIAPEIYRISLKHAAYSKLQGTRSTKVLYPGQSDFQTHSQFVNEADIGGKELL
jgi:hypothetical protein